MPERDQKPVRYPGYDVMDKRYTLSWNEPTRRVVDQRLALPETPAFLSVAEWRTLSAVASRIVPQPADRPPVSVAAMIDDRLARNGGDGFRQAVLPPMREAWRLGLAALESEARERYGRGFADLDGGEQDALLRLMEQGRLDHRDWGAMPPKLFFKERVVADIVGAYYLHPTAWNEIGYGGPASPRGYVRMGYDRRDPWEARALKDADATPEREAEVGRENRRVR